MGNQAWAFYEHHFGVARLRHYSAATGGDHDRAQLLYDWNTEISGAFWISLGHFEVSLRNTIDRRLSARHSRLGRTGHWIFDDAHELGRDRFGPNKHEYPFADVSTAIARVRKNRKPIDSGQVISEVSFGFWHQLVSKKQTALWPDLAGGFPHAPNRSQGTVHEPVKRLRDLRNRIGHHHRIWSLDIAGRFEDLSAVAGYIDPDLREWIRATSQVPAVLAAKPA